MAKAKALRVYVEPLITKSKENTTHQRRMVFSYLQDKEAVKELFSTSAKIAAAPVVIQGLSNWAHELVIMLK